MTHAKDPALQRVGSTRTCVRGPRRTVVRSEGNGRPGIGMLGLSVTRVRGWRSTVLRSMSSAGTGRAHEVALCGVAPEIVHQGQRVERLDALRDDAQVERMREVDGGANHRHGALVPRRAGEKRAIELQLGDRQPANVRERREAGAVIIDRQFDAESAQPLQDEHRLLRVGDEAVLGDLQRDARRIRRRAETMSAAILSGSDLVTQTGGGDVDRDTEVDIPVRSTPLAGRTPDRGRPW